MTQLGLIPDPGFTVPPEWEPWLRTADDVAATLRKDIVARDAAGEVPVAEFELIRRSGLLRVAIPEEYGGAGQPWVLATQIARRIARVDAGIAHILAYHYAWTRNLHLLRPGTALLTETVEKDWLWASPGSARLVGLLRSRRIDGSIVITGDVGFATGAPVADRLYTYVQDVDSGRIGVVAIDPTTPGVTIGDGWDMLGQRLSASPAVRFVDVSLPDSELVIEFGPAVEPASPIQSLSVLNFQLLFAVLELGIAEGALLDAAAYVRDKASPWYHSTVDTVGEEPFILNGFGAHLAAVESVAALVERGEHRLQWLNDNAETITAADRAHVAEAIASAKVTAIEVALEVTGKIYDLTGARGASTSLGLDRHWRNARTLSLHDPLAYKHNELGRYFLNGEYPSPSGYR